MWPFQKMSLSQHYFLIAFFFQRLILPNDIWKFGQVSTFDFLFLP